MNIYSKYYLLFLTLGILNTPQTLLAELSVEYKLSSINYEFQDTKNFDKATLNEAIFLSKKGVYNQIDLGEDIQRLKKFYFDNGFFDALIDTTVEYFPEDKEAEITFIIYEKTQYRFREISYFGIGHLGNEIKSQIYSDQRINAGTPYTKTEFNKEVDRVLDILQNNGYLNARIDTVSGSGKILEKYPLQFRNFNGLINGKIYLTGLDEKYYFGKTRVNVISNKYNLEDKYVLRLLQYNEGELYSREKQIQSERNLSKLAIIQTGRVQIDSVDESNHKVELIVNINLNKKFSISPSIVATDIDGIFYGGAGITYSDKYFIKGGTIFTLGLEGLYHNRYTNRAELKASLYQPYFFTPRISANYNTSFLISNLDKNDQYLLIKNLVRLNYSISEHTFYKSAFGDLTIDMTRKRTEFTDSSGSVFLSSITKFMNSVTGVTFIHDNTNDIFNPSSGLYHSVTGEIAGFLPKTLNLFKFNIHYFQYYKFYSSNRFFFDMTSNASKIIATKFILGTIVEFGQNNENVIPLDKIYKFYSGGGSSLRGWGSRENGILANTEDGGEFQLEGSLELRWRTFFDYDGFLKNLWTVWFLDWGNVWEKQSKFRWNEIALAAGLGVRYNTFVGPIRIDLGFKLYDPTQPEGKKWLFNNIKETFSKRRFAIQFGLGNAF